MAISLADNTLTKLPFFSENQVLKASDLNNLVSAVTNQLRLNRIYNVGLGIVEGFSVEWVENDGALVVSRGFGVSSDGYGFDLKACSYNYFREIENTLDGYRKLAEKCEEYDTLMGILDSSGYELREFGPLEIVPDGWNPLAPVEGRDQLPVGTYCLLYLYREEEIRRSSCFNDCEGQGADQTGMFHAVLVPSGEYIKPPAGGTPNNDANDIQLPEVPSLKAFGFYDEGLKLCKIQSWETFYTSYRNPCEDVREALAKAYGAAQEALQPTGASLVTELNNTINKLLGSSVYPAAKEDCIDIQYCYAYFQDLIGAYADLYLLLGGKVEKAIKENDTNIRCLFPGHLALRGINVVEDSLVPFVSEIEEELDPCRTARLLPDTNIERVSLKDKAILLLERMRALVNTENLRLPTWENKDFTKVHLTPDVRRFPYLKGRALPFYFQSTSEIMDRWREGEQPNVKAFQYTPNDTVHPLRYTDNGDGWDFYRIEGHLGYPLVNNKLIRGQESTVDDGVFAQINDLRDCLNLSFDVVAVNLDAPGRGEGAPPIAGSERDAWYKNTRADLLRALWVFSQVDPVMKADFFREILKPVDGNIEGALNHVLEVCNTVITFLEEYEHLFEIKDWLDFEEVDFCDPIPDELTSLTLNAFVEAYNEFTLIIGQLRNADGVENPELVAILPILDPALGNCIREVAVKERLAREAIWRDTFLAGFAQNHQGLVHRGGVDKGGTLVLVYKEVEDDFRIIREVNENFFDRTREQMLAYIDAGQFDSSRFKKRIVVADFSLPYLCCGAGPVYLRQVALPPLELTVGEVDCADKNSDKTGLPVTITTSEEGGTFLFTAAGKELSFTAPTNPSEEYLLEGLVVEDFSTSGALVITVEYTLDSRCEVKNFTVFRRPEIGESPLVYKEVLLLKEKATVLYDLNLESSFLKDEIEITLGGTDNNNLYDETLGQVKIPLEVFASEKAATIKVRNKNCDGQSTKVNLCSTLSQGMTLKSGCRIELEGCKLNCNVKSDPITGPDINLKFTRNDLGNGLIALCPAVPGGVFLIESTTSSTEEVDYRPEGLILEKRPTVEGDEWQYHLVLDFEAFNQAIDLGGKLLECYGLENQFPFQLSLDKYPSGFITYIKISYSLGDCKEISQIIEITVNSTLDDGDVFIAKDVEPKVISPSVALPTSNFAAILNIRRNGRLDALKILRETDGDPAGEDAFKRTFLYLNDTGENVNPKKGLINTLEALAQLNAMEPELVTFVRKSGELLATSFLDKLALVGKKEQLTKTRSGMLTTLKEGLDKIGVNRNTVFSEWSVSELYNGLDRTRLTNIGKQLRD